MKTILRTWNVRAGALLIASAGVGPSTWAAAPPNDDFANAHPIPILQGSVTGSNIGATRESGEPDHAGNPGGASVWWQFTPPESGYLTLSTLKSTSILDGPVLDTELAVYTGSRVSDLVLIGANEDDEETASWASKLQIPVTGGVRYYIAVDGYSNENFGPDWGRIVLEVSFSRTITYKAAPAWQLPDLQGNRVAASDFTGQVMLLNFWATWCAPCIEEIPELMALQEQYHSLGLVVVGISMDDAVANELPLARVTAFAQNLGMNYPVVMTRPGGGAVESAYGPIDVIPTTFVIDRRNNIVRRVAGRRQLSDFQGYVLPHLLDSLALRAQRAGGRITLEWPTLPVQVSVQSCDRLPASSWNPLTGTPVDDGQTTSLSVEEGDPGSPTTRFYRLLIRP